MAKKIQKLELTWIGKGEEPRLEPRILVENPEYSFGDPKSENILIHGDNLLALKSLEQDFSNRVKFVYIDPPFNTGAAFDHYDDGIEHSIWLDLMFKRLTIIYNLLTKDGSIMIHLDDNESDYCKVMLDQIFERENFISRITIDARSPSAFSTVNPGVFKSSEYILWYAKNKANWESRSMRIPSTRDIAYNKFILNRENEEASWVFKPLKLAFLENLNFDRLGIIKQFINELFAKGKALPKNELSRLITIIFPLHSIFDLKQVSTYLFSKLKLENYDEYYGFAYPYLLDKCSVRYNELDLDNFVFDNSKAVCRETEISDDGAGKETVDLKYESLKTPEKILKLERENGLDTVYVINGKQISFYSKNVTTVEGKKVATKLLTNIWDDISWEGIAKEGGVQFKKGKKPERLLKRCIELNTNEGDIVLDSFLGSGTTMAVSHKMCRKWIGIERGEHIFSHSLPRIKSIVSGKDSSGISSIVKWQGGGGFKFYNLAPSLLNQDKYGNWVISKEYNPSMLAAAMAKQEGFYYQPDISIYWKQGKSSEKDYIYTTTQFITVEMLDKIHDEMKLDESLLISCKSYQKECENKFGNISIKKIPQMLLGKCEFGKEDYSLNIVNLPKDDTENYIEIEQVEKPSKSKKEIDNSLNLFD